MVKQFAKIYVINNYRDGVYARFYGLHIDGSLTRDQQYEVLTCPIPKYDVCQNFPLYNNYMLYAVIFNMR